MEIQEKQVNAVTFSSDYDDVKLFQAATKFLKTTRGWFLVGLNYGSDDCASHLTLFLEQVPMGSICKAVMELNNA